MDAEIEMEEAEMPMQKTETYNHPKDEETVVSRFVRWKNGVSSERVVDIFLAAAEAERDVNAMLDILRNPSSSKYKKTKARKFLREHALEYADLCKQRDRIGSSLSSVPV